MLKTIVRNKFTYWILFLYAIALGWWILLQFTHHASSFYFYGYYSSIALSGGIYAVRLSIKRWGGLKSVIGRGIIGLGAGLLGQGFGLLVWTYYNLGIKVDLPYPSLADVGYFALIPAYAFAALMFAKAAGAQFSLRERRGKLQVLVVPIVAFLVAYGLFLRKVGIDTANPVKAFLDIGYPMGEIIPVSIALLTLTLSHHLLGGTMRNRIRYLVFAFFFQFLTEYTFLYIVGAGLFTDGGISDLMYLTSYTIMSLGIISFSEYQ